MNEKIQEVQNIINKLEGKEINISATNCLIENGDIIYDYKDQQISSKLDLHAMDNKELEDLKEELEEYV